MKNLLSLSIVLFFLVPSVLFAEEAERPELYPPKVANPAKATRPPAPELLEPTFMAKIQGASAMLKWAPVADATNYHLQVSTDPNFKWLVVNEMEFKGTSYEVKSLEAKNHYYWRVFARKAENDPGTSKSAPAKSMFETL